MDITNYKAGEEGGAIGGQSSIPRDVVVVVEGLEVGLVLGIPHAEIDVIGYAEQSDAAELGSSANFPSQVHSTLPF